MVIERKIIDRVSIEPDSTKNVRILIDKINNTKGIELLKIVFESSGSSKGKKKIGFGKNNKLKVSFTNSSMSIPRQVHKITNNYTITDLKDAIDKLEIYAIREIPTYIFDAYPIFLTILDRGRAPNYAQHILTFDKVRKIAKGSLYAKLLETIHMPIDLIEIYKAKPNPKAEKDDNVILYKKSDIIRDINGKQKYVEADDVYHYTRNIYHSDFTVITTCEVGIETKETKNIIQVEGGGCSTKDKKPDIKNEEEKQKEEEDNE